MAQQKQELEVEWREPPPRGSRREGSWASVLEPLVKNPSRWAMVYTAESAEQASNAQQNLHQRKVRIPRPEGNWEFVARGCEVFAIYRGGGERRGSVRRAKRQR